MVMQNKTNIKCEDKVTLVKCINIAIWSNTLKKYTQ